MLDNESHAKLELRQEKRFRLAQKMRTVIAKVLREGKCLTTLLPVLSSLIAFSKKCMEAIRVAAMPSTPVSSIWPDRIEELNANSLLRSALSVLRLLVQSSESCRRSILWDEKNEQTNNCDGIGQDVSLNLLSNPRIRFINEHNMDVEKDGKGKAVEEEEEGEEQRAESGDASTRESNQAWQSLALFFVPGQDALMDDNGEEPFARDSRVDQQAATTARCPDETNGQRMPERQLVTDLQRARVRRRTWVHVPKLLPLLLTRVLPKKREAMLVEHEETLQIIQVLTWNCPTHLLHK